MIVGGLIRSMTASIKSLTPSPVFPLQSNTSSFENPKTFFNSSNTFGTLAFGKSILLMTGIMVKSCSSAK